MTNETNSAEAGKKAPVKGTPDVQKQLKAKLSSEMPQEEVTANRELDKLIKRAHDTTLTAHEAVHSAAMACLEHFTKYGDARPMDRLIKGFDSKVDKQPLIFWVRQNSPISWDSEGNVRVAQAVKADGTPNDKYVKPDLKKAEAVPFDQTPEAKARANTNIQPFNALYITDRVDNIRRMFDNALKEDSKRPFDDTYGDKNFVEEYIDALQEISRRYKRRAEELHESASKRQAKKNTNKLIKAKGKKAPVQGKKATVHGVAGHA